MPTSASAIAIPARIFVDVGAKAYPRSTSPERVSSERAGSGALVSWEHTRLSDEDCRDSNDLVYPAIRRTPPHRRLAVHIGKQTRDKRNGSVLEARHRQMSLLAYGGHHLTRFRFVLRRVPEPASYSVPLLLSAQLLQRPIHSSSIHPSRLLPP